MAPVEEIFNILIVIGLFTLWPKIEHKFSGNRSVLLKSRHQRIIYYFNILVIILMVIAPYTLRSYQQVGETTPYIEILLIVLTYNMFVIVLQIPFIEFDKYLDLFEYINGKTSVSKNGLAELIVYISSILASIVGSFFGLDAQYFIVVLFVVVFVYSGTVVWIVLNIQNYMSNMPKEKSKVTYGFFIFLVGIIVCYIFPIIYNIWS